MKVLKSLPLAVCLSLIGVVPAARVLASEPPSMETERTARWKAIAAQIFGNRTIEPTQTLIKLEAPVRAEDAALVPVALTMPEKDKIKSVYLVIDENPSPFAAHVTFGPAADAGALQLRVRVDSYTNVHAVAETKDGRLYETAAFVKASGGCSAPAGTSDVEARKGMGEMRMKLAAGAAAGQPVEATLMIRHPNFNGMQMDQVTRNFTSSRYIDKVSVTYGDAKVLDLDTDISLSSNPVITFSFIPDGKDAGKDRLKVVASDTRNGRWEQSFGVPAPMN